VFLWATGRQHLELANVSPGLPRDRIATLLLAVGLGDAEDRPVGTYSQGMRQRLGIARALLADPEVLVLDEPSNGLDPHGIHWLRDLVRERAAAGRTVVVSSHLLAEMQLFADTVVMLAGGAVLSTIALADLPPGSGSLEAYYFATLASGESAPSP
jgi:ABC-2 type transport system ATP-binding protein